MQLRVIGTGFVGADLKLNLARSCVTLDRSLASLSVCFIHSNVGVRNPYWRGCCEGEINRIKMRGVIQGPVLGEHSGSHCRLGMPALGPEHR